MDEAAWIRRRLLEEGADAEEVAAQRTVDDLVVLSGELPLRPPGPPASLRAVATAAGLEVDRAADLVRLTGLRVDDLDELRWFESDVAWLRGVDAALSLFDEAAIRALLRRVGVAMAQLAHASASAFRVNVLAGDEASARSAVERNLASGELVQLYIDTFTQVYRHHARTTIRPDSVAAGRYGELRPMAVAFVDLTASTEIGERATAAELAALLTGFEAVAFSAATHHGARVIKTIGDEVMLAADEPARACRAALDIVRRCVADGRLPAARGGVAAGDVLDQDGDCHGPVVNRAARFVQAAADGSVMVDEAVVAALPDDLVVEERPPVAHRGLGERRWWAVRPV